MNNLLNKLKLDKLLLSRVQYYKLMLDKIQLDNRKISLIILACLIIIYLDFTFLLKLQLQSIKKVQPKIIRLKKDLDDLTKGLDSMQNLNNEQLEARQKILSKTKRIVSEDQVDSLLQIVSDMANKNNVVVLQMKPSREPQGPKQKKTPEMEKFIPILISLDLSCDYHQLGKFINDLENAQTFIAVQDLKILPQPADYLKQKLSVVLKTYVTK